MAEQPAQHLDLRPMRTFMVTSIVEMAVGLQELHTEIDERMDDLEYRGEYFRVLAGLAGISTLLAIANGGKYSEFGELSQRMQKLVMMEYDRIRNEPVGDTPPSDNEAA